MRMFFFAAAVEFAVDKSSQGGFWISYWASDASKNDDDCDKVTAPVTLRTLVLQFKFV